MPKDSDYIPAPFGGIQYYKSGKAWVVHIDTGHIGENDKGPSPLRVYINDGEVYENPPYEVGHAS